MQSCMRAYICTCICGRAVMCACVCVAAVHTVVQHAVPHTGVRTVVHAVVHVVVRACVPAAACVHVAVCACAQVLRIWLCVHVCECVLLCAWVLVCLCCVRACMHAYTSRHAGNKYLRPDLDTNDKKGVQAQGHYLERVMASVTVWGQKSVLTQIYTHVYAYV